MTLSESDAPLYRVLFMGVVVCAVMWAVAWLQFGGGA